MGAGFVAMPYACRAGGWAALGVLWALGGVFLWTGLAVLDAAARVAASRNAACDETNGGGGGGGPAGYEDVAEAAFGAAGRRLVSLIMYAELLGICTVYLVLEVRWQWATAMHA